LSKHIDKDSRVIYDKSDNQHTLANSRNRGISLAKGDFIALLDADDIWKSNKLEKQLPLFDNADTGFVCSYTETVDTNGKVLNNINHDNIERGDVLDSLLAHNFVVPVSSSVVRKSILDKFSIKQKPGRHGTEDYDFWLNLSKVTKLDYVPEPLIQRRVHDNNMSKNLELMYSSQLITIRDFKNGFSAEDSHYKNVVESEVKTISNFASWLLNQNRLYEAKVLIKDLIKLKALNLKTCKLIIILFLKKIF
jgi:glycosyltransferase involved in cell wall biosynthesis